VYARASVFCAVKVCIRMRMCNFANLIANRYDLPQRAIVYFTGRVCERVCEPSALTRVCVRERV